MAKRKKQSSSKIRLPKKSTTATDSESVTDGESNLVVPGFGVVGIGASAGGLEAFKQLFLAMPPDTGMAFVLIQHLDPTHESLTAELLGKHTEMKVVQVTDGMTVEPNQVYVIPPNTYLTVSGDHLQLTEPVFQRGVRVPIDFFFRSLANDQQQRAIGIVLSGTGSDGTLGAREIKASGGMVMAQSPDTASHDGMPRSVIATGVVDYVLPIEDMPDSLIRYVDHWYVNGRGNHAINVPPGLDYLNSIIGMLRARQKYDFSCYKKGTLTRRIQRRMGLRRIADMGEYAELLRSDRDEVLALYKDLLIGVTNFFRDPDAWNELARRVIEPLVADLVTMRKLPNTAGADSDALVDVKDSIRVWSPGCATGEEPYSIAMLIAEAIQKAGTTAEVNIFASDIDTDALAYARAAIYPESIAADLSQEQRRQFFVKGEHTFRVNKDIRDFVVFAEQNLISDPPFSKLDLISCRNLLIYLEPRIQQKILSMFHFALREGGYLFLGNAETIGQQGLFEPISRKLRIFRRVSQHHPYRLDVPPRPLMETRQSITAAAVDLPDRQGRQLSALASQAILQRFAPACVLVDQKGTILYLTGPVDDYLQLPVGEARLDLFATARPGLRTRLRAALSQVMRENKPLVLDEVRVKRNQKYFPMRVSIEPIQQSSGTDSLLLIAFEEEAADQRVRVIYVEPPQTKLTDKPTTTEAYESVIHHLEGELTNSREDLQTTVEELETSNEEFKAANEVVTSINEELQSTNEELETSKEELQSMNEELQTVNHQLESKVDELQATTNDLFNLLASIDQATVFLDRALRIRRFTPAATRLFRVIDTDVGRSLIDITRHFIDDDLLNDIEKVLTRLATIEKEVHDDQDTWYLRRVMPYRTEEDRIDGVVITFVDISDRKRAADAINEARKNAEAIVATVREPLVVLDQALRVVSANVAFYDLFDVPRQHTEGRLLFELGNGQWDIPGLRHLLEQVLPNDSTVTDYEVTHEFESIGIKTILLNARRIDHNGNMSNCILIAMEDITERKRHEDELKSLNESLERQVGTRVSELRKLEQMLAESAEAERQSLGQDLHDSLCQQITAIGMLAASMKDEFSSVASPATQAMFDNLETNIEKAQTHVRSLIAGLMPVDIKGGGLSAALERLVDEMDQIYDLKCEVNADPNASPENSFDATQLFLIAREATINAAKHAKASCVIIRLSRENEIRLSIRDDGIGLSQDAEESSGMGMSIMKYRAGLVGAQLKVESPKDGGTEVSCVLARKNRESGEAR